MTRPEPMTVRSLATLIREIATMLEHESHFLALYHAYGQRFGASPGSDVFEFVLRDALRGRGMTLAEFEKQ